MERREAPAFSKRERGKTERLVRHSVLHPLALCGGQERDYGVPGAAKEYGRFCLSWREPGRPGARWRLSARDAYNPSDHREENAMLKKTLIVATLAALALGSAAIAQQMNAPVSPSPVKRTLIGKIEVPGGQYEVITAMVELAPSFRAGRHFHPGIVQAQILEGEFLLALDGQPEKTFTAGQSLEVPNKAIHNEGVVGPGPAKLIAVYLVEKGQPLVNPVQ